MSVTNVISNEEITLVQGVGGLFFCEESWVTQSRDSSHCKKILDKEDIAARNETTRVKYPRTELLGLL
ncbi:hypothetical protein HQ37_06695 [Porphyromonas sp. COT-239 OH1446]|nr:hypothetical protein HQ37_06695 [Porphyromonas sp. COT-239 OH1446]